MIYKDLPRWTQIMSCEQLLEQNWSLITYLEYVHDTSASYEENATRNKWDENRFENENIDGTVRFLGTDNFQMNVFDNIIG